MIMPYMMTIKATIPIMIYVIFAARKFPAPFTLQAPDPFDMSISKADVCYILTLKAMLRQAAQTVKPFVENALSASFFCLTISSCFFVRSSMMRSRSSGE